MKLPPILGGGRGWSGRGRREALCPARGKGLRAATGLFRGRRSVVRRRPASLPQEAFVDSRLGGGGEGCGRPRGPAESRGPPCGHSLLQSPETRICDSEPRDSEPRDSEPRLGLGSAATRPGLRSVTGLGTGRHPSRRPLPRSRDSEMIRDTGSRIRDSDPRLGAVATRIRDSDSEPRLGAATMRVQRRLPRFRPSDSGSTGPSPSVRLGPSKGRGAESRASACLAAPRAAADPRLR